MHGTVHCLNKHVIDQIDSCLQYFTIALLFVLFGVLENKSAGHANESRKQHACEYAFIRIKGDINCIELRVFEGNGLCFGPRTKTSRARNPLNFKLLKRSI